MDNDAQARFIVGLCGVSEAMEILGLDLRGATEAVGLRCRADDDCLLSD